MTRRADRQTAGVVLAGGRATRLAAAGLDVPKPMIPVAGRPFLAWLAATLARGGLAPVVILAGHRGETIAEYFTRPPWPRRGVVVRQTAQQGTGADLLTALPELAAETVLVANGDTVTDLSIPDLLTHHHRTAAAATLALSRRTDAPNRGAFLIDHDGQVRHSAEAATPRPLPPTPPGAWHASSTGVLALQPDAVRSLDPSAAPSLERHVIPALIDTGGVRAYDNGTRLVLDFGTPDRLEILHRRTKEVTRLYGPPMDPPATVRKPGRPRPAPAWPDLGG